MSTVSDRYKLGGLEPADERKTLSVDDTDYIVSDKFKIMLRDSFLDWGTFLEVYHDNLDHVTMFDQVVKLLNIKENENLRDVLLPMVKKIYHLSLQDHMTCMMTQFMLYEPVSIAIHSLFTVIKHHYETIVELFVNARNKYIAEHKLKAKPNDWYEIMNRFNETNQAHGLESSSVILLFLNPKKSSKVKLNFKIPGKEELVDSLITAVKDFHYAGFCPKVPHQRLSSLLQFPINTFITTIKALDPEAKFPNYKKIESLIAKALSNKPAKPDPIKDDVPRKEPPDEFTSILKAAKAKNGKNDTVDEGAVQKAKLQLIKWYVDQILDLRKTLLDAGRAYEDYYTKSAELINNVTDLIKKELTAVHYK